jgi:hypothetical protein
MVHLLVDAATINPRISGRIIQVAEFPGCARRHQICRTPTLVTASGRRLSGNVPPPLVAGFLWRETLKEE